MIGGVRATRGWTLLELLVCVCVVAILLGLSFRGLRSSLLRSQSAIRLSQLSTHGRMLGLYSGDFKDCFPFLFQPGSQSNVVPIAGRDVPARFFDSYWCWNALVGRLYYPGGVSDPSFQPPKTKPTLTSLYYWYSATLVASPEFWNHDSRIGPQQWTAQRLSGVQFPSAKVQIVNWGEVLESGRTAETGISLVDGSAKSARNLRLEAPVFDGEGNWDGSALKAGYSGIHTIGGVRGRDVQSGGN